MGCVFARTTCSSIFLSCGASEHTPCAYASGQVLTETNALDAVRTFTYNTIGKIAAKTDRNGRAVEYGYDGFGRQTSEVWLNWAGAMRTLFWSYESTSNRLSSAFDPAAEYDFTYDDLDRVISTTHAIDGLTPIVAIAQSLDGSGRRVSQSATLDSAADFQNSYSYDRFGRLSTFSQSGITGGDAIATKRVDFAYNRLGQFNTVTRYGDTSATQTVAASAYAYDGANRLTVLSHAKSSTSLASHSWSFDKASRMTQYVNSVDGTVDYTSDPTDQLTGADYTYSPTVPDETYVYDDNGNRINAGFTVDTNNQLLSDGTYTYTYDAEGNRATRTKIADGTETRYTWDHRNRLVQVAEYASSTATTATSIVENTYDIFNRWIKRELDSDGDDVIDSSMIFVYDGNQIVMEFDKTGTSDAASSNLSHRYTWGPVVDETLADEQVSSLGTAGSIVWQLCDHLNTVRDLAGYDSNNDTTTVSNHRVYNAFGAVTSETNSDVTCFFGFTARPFDVSTSLQNNLNRWYDSAVGRWLSEDPIEADINLYRYCGDNPTTLSDPMGEASESGSGSLTFADQATMKWGGTTVSASINVTAAAAYVATDICCKCTSGGCASWGKLVTFSASASGRYRLSFARVYKPVNLDILGYRVIGRVDAGLDINGDVQFSYPATTWRYCPPAQWNGGPYTLRMDSSAKVTASVGGGVELATPVVGVSAEIRVAATATFNLHLNVSVGANGIVGHSLSGDIAGAGIAVTPTVTATVNRLKTVWTTNPDGTPTSYQVWERSVQTTDGAAITF